MKEIRNLCIALTTSAIGISGCSYDSSMFQTREAVTEPASVKTVTICERDPDIPLTDYQTLREDIMSRAKSAVELTTEDFIGCSYKTAYYPIEDANNIGFPVIDIKKYTEDYPERLIKVPINQSFATSYSYADFDRMTEKTDMSSKLTIGSSSNILKVFSHSSETTFNDVFSSYSFNSQRTVYGESTISYYADRYALSLPPGLYGRITGNYLTDTFLEYLYSSSPEQLFNTYGCFALTQFISGANATALFTANEKSNTSATLRESHMDNLISASVGLGDLFSVGVSFGNSESQSSGDTIAHNFSDNAFSVHTYGGTAAYNQFTPPKDVNDAFFDLSSWCKSLLDEETHTIANIPENSLIPLYELIEEDNLKERLQQIMSTGNATNKDLDEPYIYIWNIPWTEFETRQPMVDFHCKLYTRYGNSLHLSSCYLRAPNDGILERFISYESARLKKQYPGLKIVVQELPPIDSWYTPDYTIILPPGYSFPIDTSAADINLNLMKKYIDPASGKLYLLPDENNSSDIVYTVYNDATLNDYTIKNKIENMESVTGIDLDAMREAYRIIAL